MPIRNLAKIFKPKHVAVIGASRKADSIGRTVLENLAEAGFPGAIYPVNPKYKKIGDHERFATVAIVKVTGPSPHDREGWDGGAEI